MRGKVGLLLSAGLAAAAVSFAAETLWVVPHTHWEGAVFKTREEYLDAGLTNILKAVMLLKKYPEYRFALDQVAYVKPFLERYPEQVAAFRQFVKEGRLQIVGGVDTMHDNNMPSGESIVRQFLYGKRYYREALGVEVTAGWALDTFGHNAQMPQLLKLAGYESYWCRRGVPHDKLPAEFLWEGIDGTRIPAYWLAYGYGMFYGSPRNLAEFAAFANERFDALTRFARGPDRVVLAGADVSDPEEHLPPIAAQFNKSDTRFQVKFAVPREWESIAKKRGGEPFVLKGELNPVFQGIYSSRIELKQYLREMERLLTTAEKLSVMAARAGVSTGDVYQRLERAWEPTLFNEAHDLASGVMVDKVYEDTLRGYRLSESLGHDILEEKLAGLTAKIDTSGEGSPVVVYNTLGWERTDIVEVEAGFTERGLGTFRVEDSEGGEIPAQTLDEERYGDGGLRRVRLAFLARKIPAMGYAVYRVKGVPASNALSTARPATPGPLGGTPAYQDKGVIENEYYRLTFNLWNAELSSVMVKRGGWELLSGPGNVVAREQDGGDFWELYGILSGGRMLAMTTPHPPPSKERARFSNEWVGGRISAVRNGPVYSEFTGAHPFGEGEFSTTVRVYHGMPRIDIRSEILNQDKLVRYRVLFPTTIHGGKPVHEIAFGAIERPDGVEYPAQNWFARGDGQKGLAVLNRGLPGSNVADNTFLLSLARSAKILSYTFHGGYEPGVGSDSGLELGALLRFHYALLPFEGSWGEARVYRAGLEFNNPLIARKAAAHAGPMPKRWGLLEVSDRAVVASALKPAPDGDAVLRVYEATGKPAANVTLRVDGPIEGAWEANLIEDQGKPMEVKNGAVRFDLHPYEIKTMKIRFAKGGKS